MKKFLTLLFTAVLGITMAFGLTACGEPKSNGTLKVGVTDYKPLDYKDDGGNWIGFDADLAKEVGKILNYNIEFVEIDWNNKVMSINAKEIDVIWNGMTINDDLKAALTLSSPYLENKQVIVCQKSVVDQHTTIAGFVNASEILVETGSAGEDAVTDVGFAEKITGASAQKDTLLEVKTSATKVAVIDKLMAQVVVGDGTSYSDLTFVDVGFKLEQFGIGFRKEDVELKDKVESAIQQLKDNGTYETLLNKYFG